MPELRLRPRAAALNAALHTYIGPRLLAQDSRPDFTPAILKLRRGKPFSESRDAIDAAIRTAVRPEILAHDADIDDVAELLDAIEAVVDQPAASIPEGLEEEAPMDDLELADVDDDGRKEIVRDDEGDPMLAKVREFVKNLGVGDDVLAQFDAMIAAEGEPEEHLDLDIEPDLPDEEEDDMTKDRRPVVARDTGAPKLPAPRAPDVKKPAMDENAVQSVVNAAVDVALNAERQRRQAIDQAYDDVSPVMGKVRIACDSAEAVYGAALRHLGQKLTGVPTTAYKHVFMALKDRKAETTTTRRLAADAAPAGMPSVAERFPGAARVTRGY